MHSRGKAVQVAIRLHVVQQVHAEVIQTKVGDGDAGLEVFQFDHFVLQAAKLLLAIGNIVGTPVERIVVAGGRHVGDHHAALHSFFQIDVLVQADVRPVVDELDAGVPGADAVDTAEALDDADGIPVDVVVDDVVAVLKVLAFGNAIGADEQIDLMRLLREERRPFLLRAARKG